MFYCNRFLGISHDLIDHNTFLAILRFQYYFSRSHGNGLNAICWLNMQKLFDLVLIQILYIFVLYRTSPRSEALFGRDLS